MNGLSMSASLWCCAIFCATLAALMPHAAHAVSNQGLAAHWSLNEGSGTQAGDYSGSGKTGTLFGSTLPTWIDGKRGKALSFDGSTSRVNVGSVATPATVTISAWIKTTSSSQRPVFSNRGSGVYFGIAGGKFFVYDNSATPSPGMTANGTVNNGAWRHVVWISDGALSSMYIDGQLDKTQSQARGSDTGTAYIGFDAANGEYFPGSIDDVRIYNRALSESEVFELYSSGSVLQRPANNLGLVGYWSFDDGTGTVATDFSGNGNAGTLSGSPAPSWVSGRRGRALDFDGSQNYVALPANATNFSAITITAWVKGVDTGAYTGIVFNRSAPQPIGIGYRSTSGQLVYTWNNDSIATYNWVSGLTIPDNEWTFVALTLNSSSATLYMGTGAGLLSATNAIAHSAQNPSGAFEIGRDSCCAGDRYFDGLIDDVRIYNRALSASEIQHLYRAGTIRLGASTVELQRGSSLENGLVGHWTFDGADMQSTIADRSGMSNHGYFRGGATSSAKAIGKLGQGMRFDGTDDYIAIGTTDTLNMSSVLTLSAWIRSDFNFASNVNWRAVVSRLLNQSPYNGYDFGIAGSHASGSNKAYCHVGGQYLTNGLLGTTEINDGNWHHVVCVYDGTKSYVYVDANLQNSATKTNSLNVSGAQFYIGNNYNSAVKFPGDIDDVRIYNRALTVEEIKQLYTLGNAYIRQ